MLTISYLEREIKHIRDQFSPNKNHVDSALANEARRRLKILNACIQTLRSMPNLSKDGLNQMIASRRQLLAKYDEGTERVKQVHGPRSDYTRETLKEMNRQYQPTILREQIRILEYLNSDPQH